MRVTKLPPRQLISSQILSSKVKQELKHHPLILCAHRFLCYKQRPLGVDGHLVGVSMMTRMKALGERTKRQKSKNTSFFQVAFVGP
jgi:hypothetical protein